MADTKELAMAFTKCSADVFDVALRIAERTEKAEKAAAEHIGPALQALKSAGLVQEAQAKTAEAQLGSHAQTLEILGNVIAHYTKEATDREKAARVALGTSDSPKKAEKRACYPGKRRGYDDVPSEADEALRRIL